MAEVKIIYWSGTGNTAAMAQSVADGVTAAGAEAKIIPVENASAADIADVKAFALGCPSMGAEQLEESSMEPFVDEILGSVSGKKILLFGSYGWGDGEWMRNWVEQIFGVKTLYYRRKGKVKKFLLGERLFFYLWCVTICNTDENYV